MCQTLPESFSEAAIAEYFFQPFSVKRLNFRESIVTIERISIVQREVKRNRLARDLRIELIAASLSLNASIINAHRTVRITLIVHGSGRLLENRTTVLL